MTTAVECNIGNLNARHRSEVSCCFDLNCLHYMYLIKLNNNTNIVNRILKAALVLSISLIPSIKFLVPN